MLRPYISFDTATVVKELDDLPDDDATGLIKALRSYREDLDLHKIKSYDDGIHMITDKGHGQGRGLFFFWDEAGKERTLVILLAYKKEGQTAPTRHLKTARKRRDNFIGAQAEPKPPAQGKPKRGKQT